jgi:hypothetical protein
MKRFLFYLRIAAAWALVFCAAASLYGYAGQTKSAWESFTYFKRVDDVSRWLDRLAPIKAKIPPEVKRVGYISEDRQDNEFNLTQYAIAPFILERGQGPDWMIANDSEVAGRNVRRLLQGETLEYDIESFGFGLYLIHRK